MAYQLQLPLQGAPLQGWKYLNQLTPWLERLRPVGTARDRAGNRDFFLDQYVSLLLLYFFNPALTSLRGLQALTNLEEVQDRVGVRHVSLDSLSEAGALFDPEPVREILAELTQSVGPAALPLPQEALRTLTAVDGSLLPALPRMAWA